MPFSGAPCAVDPESEINMQCWSPKPDTTYACVRTFPFVGDRETDDGSRGNGARAVAASTGMDPEKIGGDYRR